MLLTCDVGSQPVLPARKSRSQRSYTSCKRLPQPYIGLLMLESLVAYSSHMWVQTAGAPTPLSQLMDKIFCLLLPTADFSEVKIQEGPASALEPSVKLFAIQNFTARSHSKTGVC